MKESFKYLGVRNQYLLKLRKNQSMNHQPNILDLGLRFHHKLKTNISKINN